jgi:tripeptide aminopeptidase
VFHHHRIVSPWDGNPRPLAHQGGLMMARRARATRVEERIGARLSALVGISSVSGQEAEVRDFLRTCFEDLGLACAQDRAGNLIATLPGVGRPLLMNAHMDRVPPGRGHVPALADGRMRSDGTTNLGADDAAGLAILLVVAEEVLQRAPPHPPLILLCTVGEEVGLKGATAFDPAPWGASEGIVFDNAGAAGVVVRRGATYVAFDAVVRGKGGHPGKDLAGTASAIDMFRRVGLPIGSVDGDSTRISLGTIAGGTMRNAIPAEVRVAGEVRTLLGDEALQRLLASIERDFVEAASELGGSATCSFEPHGVGYSVDLDEPLVAEWRTAWEARGHPFAAVTTFIGSDANALRRHMRVFTVSTGVESEHTVEESIALAPLDELVEATIALLADYTSN